MTSSPQGEKRLAIQIAGDEVVDAYRFVHVPEEWARKERDRRAIPQVIGIACGVLIAAIVIGGVATGILNWSRRKFSPATFLLLLALLFVVNVAGLLNRLPMVTAQFSTAQPYKTQLLMLVGMGIVGLLLLSVSIGLIAGLLHKWTAEADRLPSLASWVVGFSVGSLAAGLAAVGSRFGAVAESEMGRLYSARNLYARSWSKFSIRWPGISPKRPLHCL